MKTNSKALRRSLVCLLSFEAALLFGICLLGADATTGPKIYFLLFVVVVNLPGVMLASGLKLLGDTWGSNSNTVAAWTVTFGASLAFYSACIWRIHVALSGRRSESGESKAADLNNKEGNGDGGDG